MLAVAAVCPGTVDSVGLVGSGRPPFPSGPDPPKDRFIDHRRGECEVATRAAWQDWHRGPGGAHMEAATTCYPHSPHVVTKRPLRADTSHWSSGVIVAS